VANDSNGESLTMRFGEVVVLGVTRSTSDRPSKLKMCVRVYQRMYTSGFGVGFGKCDDN
jgi:hypothetical protein